MRYLRLPADPPPADRAGVLDLIRRSAARLLPEGCGRVVEVGCGRGAMLRQLRARRPRHLYGVDLDPRALRPGETPMVAGDLRALPFGDRTLDAVVCVDVFNVIGGREATMGLREMIRVLRPGGRLILHIQNRLHPKMFAVTVWWHSCRDSAIPFSQTVSWVERQVRRWGGGISAVYGLTPPPIHRPGIPIYGRARALASICINRSMLRSPAVAPICILDVTRNANTV